MTEISAAAIEAAKLATTEALGDPFEALARRLQRDHDTALLLRNHAINEIGLELGSHFVRALQGMMIDGLDPFRKRDLVVLEPCPLCEARMVPEIMGGSRQWRHPTPEGDGETYDIRDACPLTHFRVTPLQVPKWNSRPSITVKTQAFNTKPCTLCHSSTPATYSKICGQTGCPHRED